MHFDTHDVEAFSLGRCNVRIVVIQLLLQIKVNILWICDLFLKSSIPEFHPHFIQSSAD